VSTTGRLPTRSDNAENPMIPKIAATEEIVSAFSTVGRGKPACTA
jgi:hypothetical protein